MQRYSLFAFGEMIGPANRRRVDAYAEALRRSVWPGCTVLDIGTGPGFFAILAAKLGAGHVYGVDPNPALELARELAAANGVSDRTTFVRGVAADLDLPGGADVIVSDVRGALPWLQLHIPTIVDARQRLLAPGGALIPGRDEVWAAVVHAPAVYARYAAPWHGDALGLDLSAAARRVTDHVTKGRVAPGALVTAPQRVAVLEYATITEPGAAADLRWQVERPGVGHGLSVWFDTELVDGIGFSNAPTEPHIPMYSQMFYPWREPVELRPGDEVGVAFRAELAGSRYAWSWSTRVRSSDGSVRAGFDQASFAVEPAWAAD